MWDISLYFKRKLIYFTCVKGLVFTRRVPLPDPTHRGHVIGETHKKYVLWNVYLPNAVAFHTLLSRLTVNVTTLN